MRSIAVVLSMICAVLAAPPAARAEVRTYLVDTTADDAGRSSCDDQIPGDCSLRGALGAANGRSGDDSTIVLPSGTYLLTTVASCVLHTGQFGDHNITATTLCISGRVTIRGQQNAASVVIDGGGTGRVFVVGNAARIEQVTIRGGAQLGGSLFGGGGGINNAGDLTLVDVVVDGNFSRSKGGGVYSSGTLRIRRSRIIHNTATSGGGGVYSDSFNTPVDASIIDTTIADNTSTETQGGGIFVYGGNDGGTTNIERCTISGNEATISGGGGIFAAGLGQTINVESSTISGNRAGWYYGGGIWNEGGNAAGPSRVNLRNVTVTDNRSEDTSGTRGGGGGIANNSTGIMTLANTIVAGNHAPDFAPDCYDGGGSTQIGSDGYNIIGDPGAGTGSGNTDCDLTTADGDQTNVDPQLEPLRDNGGLTETHGTVEGSPAIDGGAPSGCRDTEGNVLTGDQRGEPSPTDGDGDGGARCDSGSYENGGTFGVGNVDPPSGGNVGAVCAVLHGHRFAPGITVKLTKPGAPDIPGTPTSVSADGTVIATAFDLGGRTPGDYAVTVTNPDGSSATRPAAFRVDAGGAPDVWAEMIGPDALRRGRWTRFFFVYGNRGNADALGVPIQIAAAPGVDLKLNFSVGPPPANPDQVITDWSTFRTAVDGRPVTDYTIHSFILPLVPAGFTGTLEFRVNLPVGGTNVQPLLVPFHGQPYATADGPDADSDPDIDPDVVQAHVDGAIAYTRDVLGVPPPGDVTFLRQYITRQLARIVEDGIDSWFRNPGNTGGGGGGAGSAGEPGADGSYVGGDIDSPSRCSDACIPADGASATLVHEGRPVPPPPVGGGGGCTGLCMTGCPAGVAWPTARQCSCPPRTDPVRPFDPNGKFGSAMGMGFVSDLEPLRYSILFENDPVQASAPAQEVVVTDALDTNLLDLETFSLGPIAFGERRVFPPAGAQDYFTEVDLRPEQNLIVRIRAMLERATGVVTWRFTSLDPETGDLPEDALAGFLPPNILPPAGDGGVAFSVKARPLLPSGTEICNDADIVFDSNPAIITPQWCNGIDRDKPQSAVAALPATSTSTQIPLVWSGSDVGSRIVDYQVFASENGGPFELVVPATLDTQRTFTAVAGRSYAFYAVARDDAGNVEDAPPAPDAVTRVDLCPADPAKDDPGACGCGVPESDADGDGTPDCIDPDLARDLAVTVLRGPKRTTFNAGSSSSALRYTVVLQNRGGGVETIADAATLAALVTLELDALTPSACSPAPVIALVPPKARQFPIRLKSKAKRAIAFSVRLGCANDPAKGPSHSDYTVRARVDRSALGAPDGHTIDDVCPRRVTPPGVLDPYPDGKILDKGCGARLADGTFGGPVLLDAIVKP